MSLSKVQYLFKVAKTLFLSGDAYYSGCNVCIVTKQLDNVMQQTKLKNNTLHFLQIFTDSYLRVKAQ